MGGVQRTAEQVQKARILLPIEFGMELEAEYRQAFVFDGLDDAVRRSRRHAKAGGDRQAPVLVRRIYLERPRSEHVGHERRSRQDLRHVLCPFARTVKKRFRLYFCVGERCYVNRSKF